MAILAIPALLLAVITLPFRHEYTLVEEDLIRMMSALVYGIVTGDKTMAGFHPYSIEFSFGWYEILYAIAPHDWLHNPDLAALLINRFGVISGLLCALTCALYLSALYGRTVAISASTMFFLSPMMLPVALSGHPEMGAAACLFAAGWLFTLSEDTDHIGLTWGFFVGALILLTLGLSVRAEIVLAFPFVWLATRNEGIDRQFWWTRYGLRGLVLAAAFGIFLIMQRHYLSSSGPSGGAAFVLADFIQKFMSISKMGRGAFVFILSLGGATVLVALISVVGRTRWMQRDLYLLLILALPSLAFFLPNPQPARHFFFPTLAVCVLVGLILERWQHRDRRVLAISVLVALMNQVLIEAAHTVIISHSNYVLNYPSLTDRRFTPAAPSGAFMLDQPAMQINANGERREAILLAAQTPERLLVLADHPYYLIAHLIAGNPKLRFYDRGSNAFDRLQSETKTIVLVVKYPSWPRDITAEVLQQQAWQHWPVFVQPSTISRYDKTEVPADRLYRLSDAVTLGPS